MKDNGKDAPAFTLVIELFDCFKHHSAGVLKARGFVEGSK